MTIKRLLAAFALLISLLCAPVSAQQFQLKQIGGVPAKSVVCNSNGSVGAASGCQTLPSGLTIPGATLSGTTSMLGANTGPTTDGAIFTSQNGAKTASQIYSSIVPTGYFYFDTNRSVVDLESGTTVTNANAFGGYLYDNIAGGSGANGQAAVGVFIDGIAAIDGATLWGFNPSLGDATENTIASSHAATLVGNELDFTTYNTGTTVEGTSFILQGGAQPTNASALQVGISSGSTAKWLYGFITGDGAVTTAAINIGATATSGTSIPSQFIYLNGFNSSSAAYALGLQASNDALNVTETGFTNGVALQASNGNPAVIAIGSGNANLNLYPAGTGAVVANGLLEATGSVYAPSATGGTATKYVCSDATGFWFAQASPC